MSGSNQIRLSTAPISGAGSNLIYGKGLDHPVLGHFYQAPEISKTYTEPMILDTSLPHIAVYIHLKTYDLKPVERPDTPPILSTLRSMHKNSCTHVASSRKLYQSQMTEVSIISKKKTRNNSLPSLTI